jgi:Methyltransferase domain
MPVDREAWSKSLELSNFINCYCQYRDLQSLSGCRDVLLVGPGAGLETQVLRWRGYRLTTLDIDPVFGPDIIGSVHEMSMFADGQFDVVIASHVLEHLAAPFLDRALAEIARVGRFALVYLPRAGLHLQARFFPRSDGRELSFILDVFNYLHRPDGVTPRYRSGQHFWEVGMPGYRVRDLRKRFERHFEVLRAYRNIHWNPSHNFILRSRGTPARNSEGQPSP